MNDELNKLYTALIGKGYTTDDLGDENTFRSMMSDKNNRKDLYDYVSERGDFRIGDYDAYEQRLTSQPIDKSQHTLTAEQLGLEDNAYEAMKGLAASPQMPVGSDTLPTENRNQDIFAGRESMARYADKAQNLRKARAAYNMYPTAENAEKLDSAARDFSVVETSRLDAEKEKRTREELLAERKRLEDAKREAELRLRTRRGEIASSSGMYQMGMAPVTGNQATEITDPEMTKLYAAVNSYDNAIRSVDRKLSGEEPGFWEGVADATVRNPGFYTMGLTDMSDARGMLNIAQDGIEGREDELLADAIYSKNAEQQDEDFGFLYRAGNMFGHSVPFMVQTAVTGGFSGASRAGANLAGRLGKKAAEGTIKKKIINAMGTTIDDVIEAGLIANTAGAGGTWANIAERKAGKINIKDGDYVFENGESWLGALYKGEVSSILELYTEKLGGHLEGKLSLTKGLDKIGASRVSNVLLAAKNSDLYKGASTVMRQFGLNGYLPEVLEEEANLVLNSLLVGDNSLSELYNPRTQLDIFGGMLLTVGTMQAIPGTIATAGYVKNQYQLNRADRRASDVFGEEWTTMKEALDNATNEKVAGVVSENLRDNVNQNKALLDYYKRMMIMRGYNIGTVKNETAPEVEEAYTDGFSQEPTGANALNAMTGYDIARQEVARALGLAEGDDVDVFLNGRTAEDIAKGDTDVENAVKNYQLQKARMEGIQEKFQQTREQQYEESDRSIDSNANKANPDMTYSTTYKGEEVFIRNGNVVLNEDGTIDVNNSSETLYVKFSDGHVEMISPDKFTEVFTEDKTADLKAAKRAEIDQRWRTEFDTAEAQSVEQEKRDSGVVFDMTDAQGEHRIEILNEGEKMSDILLDGAQMEIPTEELNRWKQEAGIQSAENGVQSVDAVVDNTTDNVAPTGDNVAPVAPVENNEPAPVELPDVPDFFRLGGTNYEVASRNDDGSVDVMVDGKRETLPAGTDYSTLMPTDKKGEVQYEQIPVERTHEYFVQKVKDDEARAEMIEKRRKKAEAERKKFDKKPDPGIDPDAYEAKMTQWEADKKAAQAKVDYWNEVAKRDAEITRSETREAVNNIKPDVVEETADEFIANQLAGIKITPESFKRETGLSNAEQAQLVGVISNDGVSVERAAEIILENYDSELKALGFTGDMQDVRDIIIDVLSQGNPRSYARKGREAREAENVDQQRADAEAWAKGAFDMKLEELYLYEETILPRIIRDYEGFDENEYYSNLAENNGYDTTRESESIGRGGELLQGEQPVPAGGTPVVGVRNEGGTVSDNVQGGGQNGVAQEEVPVNEPVGETDNSTVSQTSDQVAEGSAPGQSGVVDNNSANALQNGNNELNLQKENESDNESNQNDIPIGGQVSQPVPQGEHGTQTSQVSGAQEVAARLRERIESAQGDSKSGLREVENRVTREFAQENGLWIENETELGTPFPSGDEHNNYIDAENQVVYKVNNRMHTPSILDLLDRIEQHNKYFPDSKYSLVGFTSVSKNGDVLPVFAQDFVSDARMATVDEIDSYMGTLGFTRVGDGRYSNGEVVIKDLKPRNVLADADGDIYVVDAEFEQENSVKSGETAENGGEIQEPRSVEENLDNGDKKITSYNSRGKVATVVIERDGKVVSVDSYDEGVLFEHTEYDGNGKATSVTRYDKQGNVVGTQVYEDGKTKTPMQKLADQVLARAEDKQKAKKGAEKIDDVGEKIGGARKDIIRQYADKIKLDGKTFSTMFPKPDIDKLIEAGLPVDKVAAVKAMYDNAKREFEIMKKRRGKDKALQASLFYAMYAKNVLTGEEGNFDLAYNGYVFTEWGKEFMKANIALYKAVFNKLGADYGKVDLRSYFITPLAAGMRENFNLKKLNEENSRMQQRLAEMQGKEAPEYKDGDLINFVGEHYSRPSDQFETLEEAVNTMLERIGKEVKVGETVQYKVELYWKRDAQGRADYTKAYLGIKVRGFGTVDVMEFKNMNEARAWLQDHREDFQQMAAAKEEQVRAEKKKPLPKYVLGHSYNEAQSQYSVFADFGKEGVRILKTFDIPQAEGVAAQAKVRSEVYKNEVLPYINSEEAVQSADGIAQEIRDAKNAKPKSITIEKKSRERVGVDWRNGKDATPEMFVDVEGKEPSVFGFRAIEFGNYVSQKERQQFLNDIYDALMDMSEILGVSPRALSLGGKLALAVGARGTSGASGHYEPYKNVINITKTRGAGVLAHEWLHALDRYFSNFDENMVYSNGARYATQQEYADDTRQEVKDAFEKVMLAVKASDYRDRSMRLGEYWASEKELAARALQDYVIRKLEERGQKNDFLSNHVAPEEWDGDAKDYPFPLGEDVVYIGDAFDNFFATLQEKTVDGQTVLYRTSEDAEDIPRLDKHRVGSGPLTDREVVMESDVYSKVLGKPRYYGQKQRNYVARQRAKMAQKATELAEKLNTPIEVRETAEGLTGKKAKAKGWYDVKSGNIVVVVSNHGSIEDIQATVLHEVVAHKGLRQMFGEHFDTFLDNVYNNVDAEIRAEIDALTEKYGNTREATEEYLASLAENTYFEKVNPSLWSRIKQWFLNMLTEAGIKLDFELSDNELRYILWRSHQRLVNPGIYNPVTRITDVAVRARLGIGEYAPAVEEMAHVAEEDTAEMQESVMQGQTMFRIADDVITTVDDFNSTHKGAAPTVIIDSADTLEEQLRAEGFSKEDIAESLKDYDSEFAYYHPTYDKVVINDHDVPKDELIGYLWHENAHRAVRELYTREEMERLCNYIYKDDMPRVREVLSEMGYKPEELAEEAYVRGIEDVFSKKDSRRRLERGRLKPKEDATEEEKVIIDSVNRIVDFINNGREEERADGRRAGGGYAERSTQENRRGQDEEVRNSKETGENTQAEETRFRTVEEVVEPQEENEVRLAKEAVTSLGENLNSPVKIIDNIDSVPENRRKWKGWFEPETGEVVVVMPNHVSTEDALQTVLHEVVGHRGLRAVLGEDFDGFLDGVYKNASQKVKRGINDKFLNALKNGPALTVREATEEYIAELAERDFEGYRDTWNAIRQWFRNFFRNFMNMEITDGELRYLLWKNYNRMKSGPIETILDRAMEANTGTGKVMPRTAETFSAVDAYNKSVKGLKNKFKEGWYDEMRSVRKAQEAIEKELGRELLDSENVYLYANHIPSINKNKKEVFDNKYLRPFTSLLKKLYKVKVNGKELDEKAVERYTNAKHGIERNREMSVKNALTEAKDGQRVFNEEAYKSWAHERDEVIERNLPWAEEQRELDKVAEKYGAKIRDYSGLTAIFDTEKKLRYKKIADAAYQYVADVENALGDDVKKLWGLLKGMTDYSLNEAFESGLMSKSTYEHIKQMYRYYVPLRGFTEQTAEDFFDYVEGDHSPLNAVVKTAYGRKSEADNIFATILNMANSAIVQGSKNRLKQRLLNLAMRSQTGLLSVDNAWYEKKGDTYEPVKYPENANEYADFEERMKDKEKRGEVVRHRPGLDIGWKVAETWNKTQHAVRVKRNGREYVVWVNGDPAMANAINGLLREEIGGAIKTVNQFRSKMVTQYSPTFVFTNLLRDVQSASIIYAVRRGTTMLKEFEKNVASNATDMMDLYLKHKRGTLDVNNPKERYFKEFLENGGETGYTEMISIEEYEKKLKELTKGLNMKNGTRRAFEAVGGAVDFANRCVENLCRFSAYQTSREAGISILKSIEDAKEVSVNFNRKGSGAMGQKYAKAGFMFLNPAVQSIAQRILLTKKYPKKMAAVWAGEFILGAAMPVLYSIISAALGDDDDEITGNYYNLSDYRRRSSLCLPLKDGVFHIPLSHESRVLFGLGELCTSVVMGHEKLEDAPIEALNTLAQSLPLNPVEGWMPGKNIIETMTYNFMPDAVKPIAEVVMNRDFAGNTVHNRTDFNEFMPEYMRGKRGTLGVYKTISKYLTSTDGYEKSFLNNLLGATLNPSVMEHLVEGYLGGLYTFGEKAFKAGAGAFGNEEYAEFRNIPIASSFYTSLAKYEDTPKEERTRRDWENAFRFYKDEVKGYDDKEKTAKNGLKYGEEGADLVLEQMERNGEVLMVDIFNDGNDRLKELYGESDVARKNNEFDKVEEIDQQIYAEKRNIVSLMELLADDPMIGYTFKRNKIEGPYGERETYGDVRDAKIINDIQKELKPLYEEYKDANDWGDNTKEEDLWYDLDDIERDISDAKSEMKDYPEDSDELMAEIRELRAKAMELINNYRKDE